MFEKTSKRKAWNYSMITIKEWWWWGGWAWVLSATQILICTDTHAEHAVCNLRAKCGSETPTTNK